MKKSTIWLIVTLVVAFVLVASLLYHIFYFKNFHKNLHPISNLEKEEVLKILNKSIDIEGYEIKFGGVYASEEKEVVLVELLKENSREYYYVNIKTEKVVRR